MHPGGRVLILEDDALVARAYARLVKQKGGDPIVAGTLAMARAHLAGPGPWRGFLFDVRLPDGTGVDVLEEARVAHPLVAAVVMSALLDPDAHWRAWSLEATFHPKPAPPERLAEVVARLVDRDALLVPVVSCLARLCKITPAEASVVVGLCHGEEKKELAASRGVATDTIDKQVAQTCLRLRTSSPHGIVAKVLDARASVVA